jgi:hypothetical protein
MPGEIHLGHRSEPADFEIVPLRNEESSLGEIILRRNRLHRRIGNPAIQRADGGRVASENVVGKRVDLVKCNPHKKKLAEEVVSVSCQ